MKCRNHNIAKVRNPSIFSKGFLAVITERAVIGEFQGTRNPVDEEETCRLFAS